MDYVYLVEEGAYKGAESELNDYDRGFVAGLKAASEQLERMEALGLEEETGAASLDALIGDIRELTVSEAKRWLYGHACQCIVELWDCEQAQKGEGAEND